MSRATERAPRLVLASSSPRRRELLGALAVPFEIRHPDVDESHRRGEGPAAYVRRIAVAKAKAVARLAPDALVVAADTTVVLDGHILGKPASAGHARRLLARLQGRTHHVLTGVCVIAPASRPRAFVARSAVTFGPMTRAEIAAYVATGEPMDKAGAYALQGRGAAFVKAVRGSVTNVIGLPLHELRLLLRGL